MGENCHFIPAAFFKKNNDKKKHDQAERKKYKPYYEQHLHLPKMSVYEVHGYPQVHCNLDLLFVFLCSQKNV